MFQVLTGSDGKVLAVEISEGYTREDEQAFEKAFEEKMAQGHDRVDILVKIDGMKPGKMEVGAFVKDGLYGLKHLNNMRHLAVVGDSRLEEILIKADNAILGNKKADLVEKYFDIKEMEKAWEFVRS